MDENQNSTRTNSATLMPRVLNSEIIKHLVTQVENFTPRLKKILKELTLKLNQIVGLRGGSLRLGNNVIPNLANIRNNKNFYKFAIVFGILVS